MDRRDLETRLERVVLDNRVTIAVVFPLVGAVTLVASSTDALPAWLSFHPLLLLFGTLVMRLPIVGALAPIVHRRGGLWLGGLVFYTYAIEWIGVTTGWPYGVFTYTIDLGPMFAGIPVGLPVFFVPLVLNAYLLAVLLTGGSRLTLPLALGFVLAIDLVLDPAAVALGFWAYPAGIYYGVPASNYAGWVLSGGNAVIAVDRGLDRRAVSRRLEKVPYALDDFVSFLLLWGTVNALYGQWLPFAIAIGLGLGLLRTDRFDVTRLVATGTRRVS